MEKTNSVSKSRSSQYNEKNFSSHLATSKKAISPVVATALLLVVAVVAVVGFSSWFTTYQSDLFTTLETQGSSSVSSSGIESLIGTTLYYKNGGVDNISITSIQIDGEDCSISQNVSSGITPLDVSSCLENISTSTPEIVVFTSGGISSKQVYVKDASVSSGTSGGSGSSLDCSTLNGGEWVLVPGNPTLGISDFCVMKYEAKWNGSGTIHDPVNMYCGSGDNYNISTGCIDDTEGVESKAADIPLRNVNQFEAIELCSRLGSNYHLITNNEWMTIARNVEQVPSNWADGTVGSTVVSSGGLKRGNTGETGTNVGYNGADPADRSLDTNSLAMFTLSNGETIWDLSGNLWEWTSDSIDCSGGYSCANMPYSSSPGSGWIELTNLSTYGSLSYDLTRPSNSTWNSDYGMGQMYTDNDWSYPNDASWNTTHAFLRGGNWGNGADAGAFALYLYGGPSYSFSGVGFRCSYEP